MNAIKRGDRLVIEDRNGVHPHLFSVLEAKVPSLRG